MTNSVYNKFKEFYDTSKAELFTALLAGVIISLFIPLIVFLTDILTNTFADKYLQLLGMENINFISTNSSQVQNRFSSNIFLVTSSVVYVFCLTPFLLRLFYYYNKNDFSLGENKYTRVRNASLLFILFPCYAFILALFLKSEVATFLIIVSFFSITLISYFKIVSAKFKLHNGFYSINQDEFVKYIGISSIYAIYITVTFIPFFFIFKFVIAYYSSNNIETGADYEIIVIVFLFIFIYGLLYGTRTALHSISQYIADVVLALFIIMVLYFFTPSILILPIVEITGIKDKDKDSYYYKISFDDFDSDLKANVTSLWKYDLYDKRINCRDKVNNTCSLFMSKLENSDYLIVNLKIIYRDSKQVIVCPPNFKLIIISNSKNDRIQKFKNIELCTVMESNKILPSTKSSHYLEANETNETFENFYVNANDYLYKTKEEN
ncbi:hypothetical protein [Psychrobacter sp. FDAARGOS_221]|uniref:hypothetical protein n=1 Tax=Psychrobacter sp. FDAARGOS_221 TaxID=1975705 RepID=UPI000BB54AE2|nr:hypothetical protein [Psychrobacter sp. FDAARGOS_221]PNK60162.1 hypothetical protein A6J60_004275 [Psychrobacter sp. FDAARGOS_221]